MTIKTIYDESHTLEELKMLKAERERRLKAEQAKKEKYQRPDKIVGLEDAIRDLSEHIDRKSR